MLHSGLDLRRRRLDVCLLDDGGGLLAETAVPSDADGLRGLAGRLAGLPVRAVIESMNGSVRARRAGGAGLGGPRGRRAEGRGSGAAGMQDRPHRRRGAAELSWRDLV